MSRYVIADRPNRTWGHAFHDGREVRTCFVFDREIGQVIAAEIQHSVGGPFLGSTAQERNLIGHYLVEVNGDATVNPDYWGLLVSDTLPDWAEQCPSPGPVV